ncbi:hypothetical protein CDD82_7542 [Ophiocordyceps australis]|uniref:Anaphase spindle elongation protein 1 n=1 Tax=Ophiocordyceps australis TaxID=1399860 RepID=A0A2C5YS61_9HYPO|nr:hypothetical protein CDD82_7542 [Ophiocordyceps australis]
MDSTSALAQQVNSSIAQLHGLLDDIGVAPHEREAREAELFEALAEALNNQVRLVTSEKKQLVDEANKMITTIRQMDASLGDARPSQRPFLDDDFKVTFPLTRCLELLDERLAQVSRLHGERAEQVMKLVEALLSYSSHLEPTFVKIDLPPTHGKRPFPPTFDMSPAYVDRLDAEFTRVYEEYTRRLATVQALSTNMIQLWAELGVPQSQQDGAIVKYYRDAPEQLGLHQEDVSRLQSRCDRLVSEKKNREKRLCDLRAAVETLWEKLGVDEAETKAFVNQNRGYGMRQINEFEDELARLNELKHQNLHVFVEDARIKLQDLWDALYFSEDDMLEFTPAFSDVYSDALLEAHEREVARLEALQQQRAPLLALVDKHRSLIHDRDELAASSQDASRLLMRGQKGDKRDPGKLLREEKMRKRIAKELPRVAAEARKALSKWEEEYDGPFMVHGERYLDILEAQENNNATPATRSRTPAGPPPPPPSTSKAGLSRANSARSIPSRSMTKTPTAMGSTTSSTSSNRPTRPQSQNAMIGSRSSPSKIPARAPLSNLQHGNNSPERRRPQSRGDMVRQGTSMRAPPPKMRDLRPVPELQTPGNPYKTVSGIVRPVDPEHVFDDRHAGVTMRSQSTLSHYTQRSSLEDDGHGHSSSHSEAKGFYSQPPPRQISNTSSHTSATVSENWETYDDVSEPEPDASETYYAKLRAARSKHLNAETDSQPQRSRGIPPPAGYKGPVMIDQDGNRILSGSEWTDVC